MKTRTIVSLILSVLGMVLIPLLTVFFIFGGDAMGLLFIYTLVLNPIVSIVIGILSGWGEKTQWYLPFVNAIVYLIASIVLMGFDVSLLFGAVAYFVLGMISAYITHGIKKRRSVSSTNS